MHSCTHASWARQLPYCIDVDIQFCFSLRYLSLVARVHTTAYVFSTATEYAGRISRLAARRPMQIEREARNGTKIDALVRFTKQTLGNSE
jgi:hypothetical protein